MKMRDMKMKKTTQVYSISGTPEEYIDIKLSIAPNVTNGITLKKGVKVMVIVIELEQEDE